MARLEAGTKAPAFTLTNEDGEKVSLKDFAGQAVVVYFYPADDTPGCTKEACQFNDNLKAFDKQLNCWRPSEAICMRRTTRSWNVWGPCCGRVNAVAGHLTGRLILMRYKDALRAIDKLKAQ